MKIANVYWGVLVSVISLAVDGYCENPVSFDGYRSPTQGALKICRESKPKNLKWNVKPSYSIRSTNLLPEVGDQGVTKNSCVAWTLASYLTTQIRAGRIDPKWPQEMKPQVMVSADYLYNTALMVDYKIYFEEKRAKVNDVCEPVNDLDSDAAPIGFDSAFRAVGCHGVCNTNSGGGAQNQIKFEAEAFKSAIWEAFGGSLPFSPIEFNTKEGMERMRQLLALNVPLVAGFKVDDAFLQRDRRFSNDVWRGYDNEADLKNHAMLIVGYDESRGFEVMNSFGKSWGQEGFVYIDYQFFQKSAQVVWKLGVENSIGNTAKSQRSKLIRNSTEAKRLWPQVKSGKLSAFCKIAERRDRDEVILDRNIVSLQDNKELEPFDRYRGEIVVCGGDASYLNLRPGPPYRTASGMILPPEINSIKKGQKFQILDITGYTVDPKRVKGTVTHYWAEVLIVP